MSFTIRRATLEDKPDWLRMRQGLWPEAPIEYLDFDRGGTACAFCEEVMMSLREAAG